MKSLTVLVTMFIASNLIADPVKLLLSAKLISVKSSKTQESTIRKGEKLRAKFRVVMVGAGYSNQNTKEWMSKNLPNQVSANLQTEDKRTGLTTRFKEVSLQLDSTNIYCNQPNSRGYQYCKAEYYLPGGNTMDVNPGAAGTHLVSLQVQPGNLNVPVKVRREIAREYRVGGGGRQLASSSFAGLPQN